MPTLRPTLGYSGRSARAFPARGPHSCWKMAAPLHTWVPWHSQPPTVAQVWGRTQPEEHDKDPLSFANIKYFPQAGCRSGACFSLSLGSLRLVGSWLPPQIMLMRRLCWAKLWAPQRAEEVPVVQTPMFLVRLVPLRFQVAQGSGRKSWPPVLPHDIHQARRTSRALTAQFGPCTPRFGHKMSLGHCSPARDLGKGQLPVIFYAPLLVPSTGR